jgi:hypothetical protein
MKEENGCRLYAVKCVIHYAVTAHAHAHTVLPHSYSHITNSWAVVKRVTRNANTIRLFIFSMSSEAEQNENGSVQLVLLYKNISINKAVY